MEDDGGCGGCRPEIRFIGEVATVAKTAVIDGNSGGDQPDGKNPRRPPTKKKKATLLWSYEGDLKMTGGDGIVWPGSTFGDNSKQQAPAEGDQQKRKKENITGEPCSRQSRGSPDQIRSLAVGGRPEKEKEGGGGWLSLGRAKPKR